MLVNATPAQEDELLHRRKQLKHAIMCIGILKLTSIVCFLLLYVAVRLQSQGEISSFIQIMLLVIMPAQVAHGCILLYGTVEGKPFLLEIGLWMSLVLASLETVLGIIGCIYFVKRSNKTVNFLLAIAFGCLAFSLLCVCHDCIIIYTYKQIIKGDPEITNLFASNKA